VELVVLVSVWELLVELAGLAVGLLLVCLLAELLLVGCEVREEGVETDVEMMEEEGDVGTEWDPEEAAAVAIEVVICRDWGKNSLYNRTNL
jgi:hypothetical protein